MNAHLTPRQAELLAFLRDCAADGEPPPTLDTVCRALGLRSRGSLHRHVKALVEHGYVEPMAGQRRGLHLTAAAHAGAGTLPLLGRIAAGRPLEAVTQSEAVAVPGWLRGRGECYVLEVRGDSMRDDGILDGDRIVVERRERIRDGDVVVALIDDEEATLKRLEWRDDTVVLHPANGDYAPLALAAARVAVQGVLIGQMRRY